MHECPDGCGRTYGSIKAAMLCPCDQYDTNGYQRPVKGSDWLP